MKAAEAPNETAKPPAKAKAAAAKTSPGKSSPAKAATDGKGNGKRAAKVTAAAEVPALGEATVAAPIAPADLNHAPDKPRSGPLTFTKPPGKGVERLKVGYRMVRLSEGVDDVGSRELGRLDRGDEVEVMDSFEGFLQVRTPDGVTGWIPRHTILG